MYNPFDLWKRCDSYIYQEMKYLANVFYFAIQTKTTKVLRNKL